MENVDISFKLVREKTDGLKRKLQRKFDEDIIKRYENLESSIQQSCGEGIDMFREGLQQEKDALMNVNSFMNALLTFIEESTDAFEDVDISHEEIFKKFV